MKTVIYDLYVTTDVVHGWGHDIRELCVPSLGLLVNAECAFVLGKKDGLSRLEQARNIKAVKLGAKQLFVLKRLAKAIREKDKLSLAVQKQWFDKKEKE
jgi:hypothetical protein